MATTTTSRLDVMNRLGRAMADPTRSRILLSLLDAPAFPSDLADALALSPQSVSNHLACLRDCGIAVAEPQGRRVRYEIADPHLAHSMRELVGVVLDVDDDVQCTVDCCPVPGCCS